MADTELAHAQDVVADLLETIVNTIEPVFHRSKLEGDAAFSYASENSANPSMLMDTIESAYFAFQRRLRDIGHSTTCECDACIRISDLDLKFFVHDGEFVKRHIARSEELAGQTSSTGHSRQRQPMPNRLAASGRRSGDRGAPSGQQQKHSRLNRD